MKKFRSELEEGVMLVSGESGDVINLAEMTEADNCYPIRYTDADGRLTECWRNEAAIEPI